MGWMGAVVHMRHSGEEKKMPVFPAVLAVAAVLVFLFLAGFLMERLGRENHQPTSDIKTVEEMMASSGEGEAPVYFGGKWYIRTPEVEAYLLMGIDRSGQAESVGSYIGGGQADVLLLLVVNPSDQSYRILQINRDTMTEVDILGVRGDIAGTQLQQIALAHGYGEGLEDSCENTVRAVSNLLYGMEIDGYAAIQMDALPILNDGIGGVTVTVEDDFSQVDPSLVQGETIRLKGEQALHFVRIRYDVGDATNLSRMERQRTYLSAFSSQLESEFERQPDLILKLYDDVLPYMVTDITGKTMSQMAQQYRSYENRGLLTIDGEAKMGEKYMEYYADEDSVRQVVLELFYTQTDTEEHTGG